MYITVLCVQAIPIPVQSVVCVGVPFTATYMYTSLFYKKLWNVVVRFLMSSAVIPSFVCVSVFMFHLANVLVVRRLIALLYWYVLAEIHKHVTQTCLSLFCGMKDKQCHCKAIPRFGCVSFLLVSYMKMHRPIVLWCGMQVHRLPTNNDIVNFGVYQCCLD